MHDDIKHNSKYYKLYINIIFNAQQREAVLGYPENHHILPTAMGGPNTPENKIKLTGREHYLCHYLLSKCTKGQSKHLMSFAWNMMNTTAKNPESKRYFNSRLYEHAKREFAKTISKHNKGLLAGKKSPFYNHTQYKFYNFETKEIFIGTKGDLVLHCPNITRQEAERIIHDYTKSSKNWMIMLDDNIPIKHDSSGSNNKFADNNTYKFKKGEVIEECTRHDLSTKYPDDNFSIQGLTDIVKGRQKSHRGWYLI